MVTKDIIVRGNSFLRNFAVIMYNLMSRELYNKEPVDILAERRGWFAGDTLLNINAQALDTFGMVLGDYGGDMPWYAVKATASGTLNLGLDVGIQTFETPQTHDVNNTEIYAFKVTRKYTNNTGNAVQIGNVSLYSKGLCFSESIEDELGTYTPMERFFMLASDRVIYTLNDGDDITINLYIGSPIAGMSKEYVQLLYVAMSQQAFDIENLFGDEITVTPNISMFSLVGTGGRILPHGTYKAVMESGDRIQYIGETPNSKVSGDIIGITLWETLQDGTPTTPLRHGMQGLSYQGSMVAAFNEVAHDKKATWVISRVLINRGLSSIYSKNATVNCIGTDDNQVFRIFTVGSGIVGFEADSMLEVSLAFKIGY